LEAVEELTESLANDLLDLSGATRRRDASGIAEFFADPMSAVILPQRALKLHSQVKWIEERSWTLPPSTGSMPKAQFLDALDAFLDHFSDIEDVRFKVKGVEFESQGTFATARLQFKLVGRDEGGRREWVIAWASAEARRAEAGGWKVESLKFEEVRSKAATRDLFSEVSPPAGVARKAPSHGSGGGSGFAWHGAAAADVNSDGLIDIFATGAKENYLYLNQGDGRFRDAADSSGVKTVWPMGTGVLFLDYDNDGDQDLFMAAPAEQILLENRLRPEGVLRFQDVSLQAGVTVPALGFSAVAGDIDGNGWPDIYVASYNRYGEVLPNAWHQATNGTPNLLFLNQGDGTFREVAGAWGVDDGRWSYAAHFLDVDEDGDQDLYVANDFGENALFMNQGGRFVDEARGRGVLDPGNGMGVSFGDFDNDGDLDLHVTNMSSTAGNRILQHLYPEASPGTKVLRKLASGSTLYENVGAGRFEDRSGNAGGFPSGWAWGGGFIDFDNDGWEDLYTPNGFISGKLMKDT
jgi:ketosteroid isomerase-like protein